MLRPIERARYDASPVFDRIYHLRCGVDLVVNQVCKVPTYRSRSKERESPASLLVEGKSYSSSTCNVMRRVDGRHAP